MSALTMNQLSVLTAELHELERISAEREAASKDIAAATVRWNIARAEYARFHAQIVAKFGEQNAPLWLESLHGKRPVAKATAK